MITAKHARELVRKKRLKSIEDTITAAISNLSYYVYIDKDYFTKEVEDLIVENKYKWEKVERGREGEIFIKVSWD